jgi:UDP-N-acetylglucosamine 3-dehydrogenase
MAVKQRIVVVGAGSIGMRHGRLLTGRDSLSVEFCDPDPVALNRAFKEIGTLPGHNSFEKMLDSKPDMVLVASPHELHTDQTIRALKAGAHVLCEKPMADRLETARQVMETAGSIDRVLVYGFSNHFHPGVLKSREIINSGQLGEILYVHFHVGTYGTLVNSRSRYQADTEAALLMDYVHQPDLLYWMLGKNPVGVYATGGFGGNMELKSNPNSMTMLLDYGGPLTASIHLNYIQYPDRYHFEILGDNGWIYYDLINNLLFLGDRNKEKLSRKEIVFERDVLYEEEHQAFFDAIAGKRPPESSAEDAMQSMIVLEAAIQSWKMRKRVECGPF